jgi:tetratricopeptide (TPR) repeat protein
MDQSTARLSSRFLSYALPFLYFLTSAAFYLHTYDSAQVKITIVQMAGTFVMAVWYAGMLSEGEWSMRKYWPVALPFIASLVSGLLSFFHAAYHGGLLDECLRRVFYINFALIALCTINTLQRLKRFHGFLVAATILCVGYGIVQFIDTKFFMGTSGVDPFVWRQAFGPRVFSTFGNPNFFGNFLVIVTPIVMALILKRHQGSPISVMLFSLASILVAAVLWQSESLLQMVHLASWDSTFFTVLFIAFSLWAAFHFSYAGLLFFLITLCAMSTESKGAWVGYTASFVLFMVLVLVYFSRFQSERLRRMVRRAMLLMLILCGVGVGVYSARRVDSLRFRICTWVSTWEMGLMHPVWGNGVGSFRIIYPAFRRPQIFHIEGKHNTETDHAEDEYWEVFQDEGLVGFGIFIWMILTFSLLGVRALRQFTEGISIRDPSSGRRKTLDDPRAFYMLGILSAFWGMLVHNYMDVSLRFVSSGIFLWVLAGLIGAMVVHDPMPASEPAAQPEPAAGEPWWLMIVRILLGIGIVVFSVFIFRQFADSQGNMPDQSGELLLWVIAWISFIGAIAGSLWILYRLISRMRSLPAFLVLGLMLWPLKIFWGYFMADVYHNRGIYYSKGQNWDMAIASYRNVVNLNSNYIMAYYFLGNVYTDRWGAGDFDKAMEAYKDVWAIAPNYVQSHHQAGLVYLKKGLDDKRAYDAAHQARNSDAPKLLEQVRKDWLQATTYFQKYHDIDPVFEPNYERWAWVCIQLADLDKQEGNPAKANQWYDRSEALYKESLGAVICGSPQNDMMHEHWSQNHRHFTGGMFMNLGNLRFMRGDVAGAARAYRTGAHFDKSNVQIRKNLISSLMRLGRMAEITAVWREIYAIAPQDPDLQRIFHGAPSPASHP